MASPQLIEYVGRQTAAGVPEAQIRAALAEQHWSDEDITSALAVVKLRQIQQAQAGGAAVPESEAVAATVAASGGSAVWRSQIPGTNKGTLWPTIILVFGLDLVILFMSGWALAPFWLEMLVVFGIFLLFYYLENGVYRKRFMNSTSKLDGWILGLVSLRNFLVILNSIPLIQVLAGYALVIGIIPYLIVYAILIWMRTRATVSA